MEGVVIDGGVLVSVPLGSGTADLSGNEFDTVGPFVFTGEHKYDRVILPNMCSKVCDKAFFYNESVTYLKLGSGIEKVGTYALAGWNPLTEIAVESGAVGFVAVGGVLYYGNKVVLGVNKPTIMFKENTSAIGERAFAFCDKITSLTIPETVTEIGRFAFSECMGLKSVSIPSGVDEVGYGAFFGCISVEEVSLGRGVQVLDGLSFAGMPSMVLCKIPNTIEKIWRVIGEEAFAGCSSSLFFGKTDRNGYEQIVPQLPNNNIGDLGVPVRVVFHLGGNECDFGEVATGSSFGPLIEEAAEEIGIGPSPEKYKLQLEVKKTSPKKDYYSLGDELVYEWTLTNASTTATRASRHTAAIQPYWMPAFDTSRPATSCPRFSCLLLARTSSLFIFAPPFAKYAWHVYRIALPSKLVNRFCKVFFAWDPANAAQAGAPPKGPALIRRRDR